ncbi:MAG TPA: glycosyltransferase family 4 protein [Burkholderiales bacterium]|nr:glycosyltransferase family 4 protein [Burkholderiales bacterium]
MKTSRPSVLLLGPSRDAVSGVSTHLNLLLGSSLAAGYALAHFQVGAEGRSESAIGRAARLALSPLLLALEILRRAATIVHLNTSLNLRAYWRDLAYLLVAKACGAQVVYQVHGGALPQQFCGGNRWAAAFLRATLRLPDAIVVLAQHELDAYREFVPSQTVVVLPNGIDLAPYLRRPRNGARGERPLELVYVGRLAAEKGLYEALEGLSVARAQGIAVSLVVAGSGPEHERLEQHASRLGIERDVWFAGPVQGERKVRLFCRADALLLPSYAEGLPYALLEGMAAGATPIATPVGGIPDVMIDGVHGMLVPPRDANAIAGAIARLAGDRAALARMSLACRARIASAYSIERAASQFDTLYAGLLGLRQARALPGG